MCVAIIIIIIYPNPRPAPGGTSTAAGSPGPVATQTPAKAGSQTIPLQKPTVGTTPTCEEMMSYLISDVWDQRKCVLLFLKGIFFLEGEIINFMIFATCTLRPCRLLSFSLSLLPLSLSPSLSPTYSSYPKQPSLPTWNKEQFRLSLTSWLTARGPLNCSGRLQPSHWEEMGFAWPVWVGVLVCATEIYVYTCSYIRTCSCEITSMYLHVDIFRHTDTQTDRQTDR